MYLKLKLYGCRDHTIHPSHANEEPLYFCQIVRSCARTTCDMGEKWNDGLKE